MNKQDEAKARELAIKSTRDIDDNGNEVYNVFVEAALQEMSTWKERQMIEKATKFIKEKVSDYFWWNNEECFVEFDSEECLDALKKYMEEN